MYCATVVYPKAEGTRFDLEYYQQTHLPLCEGLFAEHGYNGYVLRINEGGGPGSADLNHASIDLIFDSPEQLQAALAVAGQKISEDVANYTDVAPQMRFAEVSMDIK
jgi:uncharacterized protein (TIGR02118 family)